MITLSLEGFELDVLPELGASVARFSFEGKDVLRRAQAGVSQVLDTGSFPLVPYANRIENGHFRFEGKEYRLPLNFGEHPHSLHGHGWQAAWKVATESKESVTLAFEHAADEWPWAYVAEETYSLSRDGLKVRLAITSRDKAAMPVSLGLHPYFPRLASSHIQASVQGMWEADPKLMPTRHITESLPIDLPNGALVSKAPFVDNTFTGWTGPARIVQPELGMAITLAASPECRFFHMFVPVGENYFCAEPTTAMPNAFNRPEDAKVTGVRVLAPGTSFAIEMRLDVHKL